MNDLVYYLGLSVGGSLDKQISIMERMAAMATGMTLKAQPEIKADVREFTEAVMFLRNRYFPAMDSNPYLVPQTRRMKIAVNVVSARAFFLVDEYKLITGSLIRTRLLSHFGKDRYMGEIDDGSS
jgi:hypothetical protein